MRTHSTSRRLHASAVVAFLLAVASTGAAQETADAPTLALPRFHPSQAGDRLFGVQSPFVAGHMTPHAALLIDYAHNPLVVRTLDEEAIGSVVSHQMFAHLNASFALWNRVQVNLNLPLALVQSGEDPVADGLTFASPSGFALGDIRLGARVRILGDYYDPIQIGLAGYMWLPSGSGNFVTDGTVRGLPQLILGGHFGRAMYSVAVGFEFRSSQNFHGIVEQGSTMNGGLGFGAFFGEENQIQVGAEATFSTVLGAATTYNTNAELLFSGRYRFLKVLEAGMGIGPGVSSGIGTPDVRFVALFGYSPPVPKGVDTDEDGIFDAEDACRLEPGFPNADKKKHGCPPDTDGDGIFDKKDMCIDVPGVPSDNIRKNGCPPDKDEDGIIDAKDACVDVAGVANDDAKKHGCPPDKDGDGIVDAKDACIDVAGVANADAKKNGCPPDKDEDGIIDEKDACVDVRGVASDDAKKNGCPPDKDGDRVWDKEDACIDLPGIRTSDPATNGCPGDTDGDTIRDDKDACPLEKGAPNNKDPKQHGCPKSVRVTDTEVIILQQVQFDTGKSVVKKVSNPLLDEVAQVLKEHPEILKIEVQGHTDDRGGQQLNEKLSQDRANAVMQALITRGIDAGRLTAVGYGPNVPIADNKTVAGRQQNRRVQFVIREKKPRAAPPR